MSDEHQIRSMVSQLQLLEAQVQQQKTIIDAAEQAALAVREHEERWKLALEVNNVAVWDFDAIARTVIGSKRWMDLWDVRDGDLQPRRSGIPLPTHLIHPDELPRFLEEWYALLSGASPVLETGFRVLVLDEYRYMRLRGRVVARDAARTALRVVGTMVDIHDARQLQMQAANASKLESIGQLAAGMAQEIDTPTQYVGDNVRFLGDAFSGLQQCLENLRTLMSEHSESIPVASVRHALEVADLQNLRGEIPRAINQSLDGVQRIGKVVSAMREFSHPSQEQTPIDINLAIANTITVATNEWKYVAKVVTDLDASLPPVPVIPAEFNQVILNVVVNAAHAIAESRTTDPTDVGTIRIVTRRLREWAEINISDDGCGMPHHVQEKIFDPFFTTKPVGKGAGQGLSIAHNVIVKKHRGSISVTSEPGLGTTFTIRIPLQMPASAEHVA